MQILRVKTITEFASAAVPSGTLLVFPEQKPDGSYLWRCKDSDGNTGTIGSAGNITSINGQTGPEIVLEPSDVGAVAENLSGEYSRPDSLLAQMMFFLRNGAVNLYGTLSDLKDFMGGYFAETEHSHVIAEVTELQTELDGKADTVVFSGFQVIVQGQITQYFTTLSEAAAYINTLELSGLQGIAVNCAPGTYTETETFTMPEVPLQMNLNGATITFSGGLTISAATTLKNGGIIGNVSLAGELTAAFVSFTGDITAGRNMELINCGVIGDITVESSRMLIAGRLQLRGRLISAGRAVVGDRSWIITTDNSNPLVSSTGGSLMMTETLIMNYGTGGGVSCDNGATLPLANAFADMAIVNGTVSAGSAVTILSSIYLTSEASGAAIIWLSAPGDHNHTVDEVTGLQTALDSKQAKAAAYSLGTELTGAISVDIANGDTQYGTLSGATTLAYGSISNLEEGQSFILQLDNAAGQTFSFTAESTGSVAILAAADTGCYKLAFSKVDGKICYDGKNEVIT
ncbi:MAG: hypothetical protein PHH77_04560 [Victivallaceae bacterium]|nr:hypothetical protein [Victivallaceae bacterium]